MYIFFDLVDTTNAKIKWRENICSRTTSTSPDIEGSSDQPLVTEADFRYISFNFRLITFHSVHWFTSRVQQDRMILFKMFKEITPIYEKYFPSNHFKMILLRKF